MVVGAAVAVVHGVVLIAAPVAGAPIVVTVRRRRLPFERGARYTSAMRFNALYQVPA